MAFTLESYLRLLRTTTDGFVYLTHSRPISVPAAGPVGYTESSRVSRAAQ